MLRTGESVANENAISGDRVNIAARWKRRRGGTLASVAEMEERGSPGEHDR